ncbi:MAG TPA: hypothetical protein VGB26_07585 [Nitrospiria bacterium]|jgi:PTH1 family peptidyl-tRNA hydrolase
MDGKSSLLVKPKTFMNVGGATIAGWVKKKENDHTHLVVVHDDRDLPFARIFRKATGAYGGHGIRSFITSLGTHHFNRLKIGIGRPPG